MAAINVNEICKIIEREAQTKVNPVSFEERKPADGKVWKIKLWRVDLKRAEGDAKGTPFRVHFDDINNYIISSKKPDGPDPSSYITLRAGPRDPALIKPGQDDYGPSIEIEMNPATPLGKVLEYYEAKFLENHALLQKSNVIDKKCQPSDVINRNYGTSDMVPAAKRGQPKPKPTIRLKLDFSKYPAVNGKPEQYKTEVYDFDTLRIIDGKVIVDLATVDSGDGKTKVPLNEKNAWQFLTRDSHIVMIDIDLSAYKKSAIGFSADKVVSKLYVKHKPSVRREQGEIEIDASALSVVQELMANKESPQNVAKLTPVNPSSEDTSVPADAQIATTPVTSVAPTNTPTTAPTEAPVTTPTGTPVTTSNDTEVSQEALAAFMSGLSK